MSKIIVVLLDCINQQQVDDLIKQTQASDEDSLEQIIICSSKKSEIALPSTTTSITRKNNSKFDVNRYSLNLGCGGDQKVVFKSIINIGSGIVVVIDRNTHYSLEIISKISQPIIDGNADVVLGSMYALKHNSNVGNLRLRRLSLHNFSTSVNNFLSGINFVDWHVKARAYSTSSLNSINFVESPDGFSFDTDILLQMNSAGFRITEVSINTGMDSISTRKLSFSSTSQSLMTVVKHRLKIMGFASSSVMKAAYRFKFNEYSSHSKLKEVLQNIPKSKVLDLGCADGQLSEVAAFLGHTVTAVDIESVPQIASEISFFQHDLENGLPEGLRGNFDVVLCADVLEHLRKPDILLFGLLSRLSINGMILVSIPNFGHWYPRIRTLLGKFDYDARGILDQTHLRFFTRRSFTKMAGKAGYKVKRLSVTGTPFEVMLREAPQRSFSWSFLISTLSKFDRLFCRLRPTLFAYQFIFELTPLVSLPNNEVEN